MAEPPLEAGSVQWTVRFLPDRVSVTDVGEPGTVGSAVALTTGEEATDCPLAFTAVTTK
jgi:hypothetical protein